MKEILEKYYHIDSFEAEVPASFFCRCGATSFSVWIEDATVARMLCPGMLEIEALEGNLVRGVAKGGFGTAETFRAAASGVGIPPEWPRFKGSRQRSCAMNQVFLLF